MNESSVIFVIIIINDVDSLPLIDFLIPPPPLHPLLSVPLSVSDWLLMTYISPTHT